MTTPLNPERREERAAMPDTSPAPVRLQPTTHVTASKNVGIAGFVDVETTGLSPWSDEVIEFALVLFAFDRRTGQILGVVDDYVGLREPSIPIHPRASEVNGITLEMVRGERLDTRLIQRMLHTAEFLVAHNATFDKGFVERLFPEACRGKPWLCSMRGVNWYNAGCSSYGLQNLLRHHGIIPTEAHRGEADVHAALVLLSREGPDGHPYFRQLLM